MNEYNEEELQHLIRACALQAHWHRQQYALMKYYEHFYAYTLRCRRSCSTNASQTGDDAGEYTGNRASQSKCFEKQYGAFVDQSQRPSAPPKRKKRKKKKKKETSLTKTKTFNFTEEEENESESELELDEGFKQFLKESEKFRRERDASKQQCSSYITQHSQRNQREVDDDRDEVIQENVCVEYVDILRKGPDGSILPPTAENRKKLYEENYGTSGVTMLSLDTALQWRFNKFVDQHSPVLWPAIPLRFT